MRNFMFKCSELKNNFSKVNACVTVLKQLLKFLPIYGKYMKFPREYQLFNINRTFLNP